MKEMRFELKKGDTDSPLVIQVLKNGKPMNLENYTSKFFMSDIKGRNLIIDADATIVDNLNGLIKYDFSSVDSEKIGFYKSEFVIFSPLGKKETFPTKGYIMISINESLSSLSQSHQDILIFDGGDFTTNSFIETFDGGDFSTEPEEIITGGDF